MKLLDIQFKYKWCLTATPFVDSLAMHNIIQFQLGCRIYNSQVGNYIFIQNQIKVIFRKNIKDNIIHEYKFPPIKINDIFVHFQDFEMRIYESEMAGADSKNIAFLREVCSQVVRAICEDDKNMITLSDLESLTVKLFKQRYETEIEILKINIEKRQNLQDKLATIISTYNTQDNTEFFKQMVIEYKQNIERYEHEIKKQEAIVERRKTVYESYMQVNKNITDILKKIKKSDEMETNVDTNIDAGATAEPMDDDDTELDTDKLCPICYGTFSETIVLFVKCRHYFCQACFETCHKKRPNMCPMCRDRAELGEITFIGNSTRKVLGSKNTAMLKLIHSNDERYIMFTQFEKFITPLRNLLNTNNINAMTYKEYILSSQENKDNTRVIILSSTENASGIDLSGFAFNVIIVEPFENYIYGKEIEKQLIGRVHRINQKHQVNVHRFIISGTIEEKIYSCI
jgi:SNF2 family DNA or RNA helicase